MTSRLVAGGMLAIAMAQVVVAAWLLAVHGMDDRLMCHVCVAVVVVLNVMDALRLGVAMRHRVTAIELICTDWPDLVHVMPPEILPLLHHVVLIMGGMIAWGSQTCVTSQWTVYVIVVTIYRLIV